ncbi:MAG TPA: lipid-binding protein [Ferruginibacter sp.]|nr:lipid-binding protein [Ferruginibacter sp.]
MKQKIILVASVFILLIIVATSCQKSYDAGTTKASKISNEWWVTTYIGGSAIEGPGKFSTYNDAEGDDSIWLDDIDPNAATPTPSIWGFKCKAVYDAKALTFETADTGSSNYYFYPTPINDATAPWVVIIGGKVMLNAAKSTTGVTTDSIYFNAVFGDDPTDTFNVQGTARTNWAADDF